MFRFITAGESHGPALTAMIEGLPAGLKISQEQVNEDLRRRQQGYGRGGRMKIETDRAEFTSGVRFGETLGSPVTMVIHNRDWTNWQERMAPFGQEQGDAVTAPRPGHADLPGLLKYEREDVRDILERASARETAARVAVGSVARQLLALAGVDIISHVVNIGGVMADVSGCNYREIGERRQQSELACADPQAETAMIDAITAARERGDSLGGTFEIIVSNVLPGLGSHVQWDRRLDARLAGAMMSIQAIKGVEIGDGFAYAALPGSAAHDEIFYDADRRYYRDSNHAGGVEGGISNGNPIVVRGVMKAIPTLMKALRSVDITNHETVRANTERSDVCAVPAAAVVGEAMVAIVLAQCLLEKFAGDSVNDLLAAVDHYRRRLQR
ncbi:MAG TPA: chorismate synthase [Patescibacteria group bacterium]|nr:chorismate synthase [Patescibacteria group bacterium]